MQSKLSTVISAYRPEGINRAFNLAAEVKSVVKHVVIVINSDGNSEQEIRQFSENCIVIQRPNSGMNIGAWLAGIKLCPEDSPVICLQDECRISDLNFSTQYEALLTQPGVGMVGESFNPKWELAWDELKMQPFNYSIQSADGQALDRVTYYLAKMTEWDIDPGLTGTHLRSLVWGFSPDAKRALDRLPDGKNKEECIALEIGVSKLMRNNLDLEVVQSAEAHFRYISHIEWRSDGLSKISISQLNNR